MALQVTNLTEVNVTRTNELLTLFTQLVSEKYPNIELSRGVFHDLVLYFNSVLNAAVQENIARVMQSNSLKSIVDNPAIADDTLVDKVLSNYNLTRYEGATAVGEAVVITNQLATTLISETVVLSANGVAFRPTRNFSGILPGQAATDPGARTLLPVGDGTYAFTISIIATSAGAAGNLKRGTLLVPNATPTNVNKIFIATDITTGADALTNEEYITQLAGGLAAKTIGGRKAISATIKAQDEFKNIKHISVVGFGEPEQKRDQHSLIPISGGGRVDLYVQTARELQKVQNIMTAVYIGPSASGTIWQIIIPKDVTPGFYDIYKIAPISDIQSAGYEIISYTRGYNFSNVDYAPDIVNMVEAEFTRFKTATLRFIDTEKTDTTNLVPGQTSATYAVTVRALPFIGALQDFVSSRDIRSQSSDIVVKAAVPCFTTINFKILKKANEADPDLVAIKKEVVDAIADIGFSGSLHASTISNAAHKHLTSGQAVGKIDMFGKILRPDGAVAYLRDFSKLEIPNDPERLVTPKTTVFLTTEEDVSIGVEVVTGFNT